ncbi:MAG: elongation factor P [Acidobacteria bacterium]|nr:elongation factor P [Acidobacteriota bacterium]MBU1337991.1 elongation factor P [Acidobacteriota bacterium]MBU1474882.1 elongation factor P [Acidobacteriota bacterium]MBU4329351.1 elongation factor P [Acidobacteriota bacterium]MBU4495190.1 elongation factor P [Acidobacteriota bacterium]
MINATQLKKGMIIVIDGELYRIMDTTHVTPGKGNAIMQTKLRRLRDLTTHDYRFRSRDKVEQAYLETMEMEFLYQEGTDYIFMNLETYEQMKLSEDVMGATVNYLIPNVVFTIEMYDKSPVGVNPPMTIELKVTKTAPFMKGATAAAGNKPATLETGITINVPQFIKEGDVLKIDTREDKYLERSKN